MRVATFFLIAVLMLTFVGVAFAAEMSGVVTAVDSAKGTLSLKSGTVEGALDCESGNLIQGVKVGDQVTVQYREVGGKKVVTKVTPMKPKPQVGC